MRIVGAQITKAYEDRIDDQEFQLGAEYEDDMCRKYVFARYQDLGEGDSIAGRWAVGCDTAYGYWDVTIDSDHVDANENDPRGQCMAVLSDGQCGFFQKSGRNLLVAVTDTTVTQNIQVMIAAQGRGVLTPLTVNRTPVGRSRAADTGTALAIGELTIAQPTV